MPNFLSNGIKPSLIHASDVVLQRLNTESTDYDDDFREPTGEPQYEDAQTVLCQIHWVDHNKMKMSPGGDDSEYEGWLTFRTEDFDDIPGGEFKKSDKIISIDGEILNHPLYIQEPQRKGHYGTSRLKMFYFEDRQRSFNKRNK